MLPFLAQNTAGLYILHRWPQMATLEWLAKTYVLGKKLFFFYVEHVIFIHHKHKLKHFCTGN